MKKRLRLFFALWPPGGTAAALAAWAARAQRDTGGRVARAETIHLTLAFLGEVTPERAEAALSAARRVRGEPCAMALDEAKFWPRNRIVWAGPREIPAALSGLAANLSAELSNEGFVPERRPFAAHATLIRKAHAARELPPLRAIEWPVGEFVLVRSTLSAAGSSYETLARFPLLPLDSRGVPGLQ